MTHCTINTTSMTGIAVYQVDHPAVILNKKLKDKFWNRICNGLRT